MCGGSFALGAALDGRAILVEIDARRENQESQRAHPTSTPCVLVFERGARRSQVVSTRSDEWPVQPSMPFTTRRYRSRQEATASTDAISCRAGLCQLLPPFSVFSLPILPARQRARPFPPAVLHAPLVSAPAAATRPAAAPRASRRWRLHPARKQHIKITPVRQTDKHVKRATTFSATETRGLRAVMLRPPGRAIASNHRLVARASRPHCIGACRAATRTAAPQHQRRNTRQYRRRAHHHALGCTGSASRCSTRLGYCLSVGGARRHQRFPPPLFLIGCYRNYLAMRGMNCCWHESARPC